MFRSVDILSSHLEHLISVPVVGGCKEDLASFGYASESVFSIIAVDGGFSFCFFLDEVSVIIVDILDFIAGLRVFLGNDLIVFIVGYGDGSVPVGMSALIDPAETS